MKKLKKKYCTICGRELQLVESDYYNEDTGKKEIVYEDCPVMDCKHDYHEYNKNENRCKHRCGAIGNFSIGM